MMKCYLSAAVALWAVIGCSAREEKGVASDATSRPQDSPPATQATPGGSTQAWRPALYHAGRAWQPTPLSAEEQRVIMHKGTEAPFSGKYDQHFEDGAYACRRCGTLLYLSDGKFHSDCGWPSFDQELPGTIRRIPDPDGVRTEIICTNCGAHLGHVFLGEGYTDKNTRHCVNSVSLVFMPAADLPLKRAIFAGGCFWGVEHYFHQVEGVLSVKSGYTGGTTANPTYEQVCTGKTGHAEAVEVLFDPNKVSYEQLTRLFFEIHDPTQQDRQGPDVGSQYRSAVFCFDREQKQTAEKLIGILRGRGYDIATQVYPATKFYPAEDYHQDYFRKHPGYQDCHVRVSRFGPTSTATSGLVR